MCLCLFFQYLGIDTKKHFATSFSNGLLENTEQYEAHGLYQIAVGTFTLHAYLFKNLLNVKNTFHVQH